MLIMKHFVILFLFILSVCACSKQTPTNSVPTKTDLLCRTWYLDSVTKSSVIIPTLPNPRMELYKSGEMKLYSADSLMNTGKWQFIGNEELLVNREVGSGAQKTSYDSTIDTLTNKRLVWHFNVGSVYTEYYTSR